MIILTQSQIKQKLRRLALEILENHHPDDVLILSGINNNGYRFSDLLRIELLSRQPDLTIAHTRIVLNPASPTTSKASINLDHQKIDEAHVIIVDDVANTGRTLFYATMVMMEVLPKRIEMAVLVDRKHKLFPVHVKYVGLSLATTLNDHIEVDLGDQESWQVKLT